MSKITNEIPISKTIPSQCLSKHIITVGNFLPIIVMYGSNSIENIDQYLIYIRSFYLMINIMILLCFYMIKRNIESENIENLKSESDKDTNSTKSKSANLISIPAVVQMGKETKPARELTKFVYDSEIFKEDIQKLLMNVVIISFIHWKFETTLPIILQCVTGVTQFIQSNLVQCYILGAICKKYCSSSAIDVHSILYYVTYPYQLNTEAEREGVKPAVSLETLLNRRPFPEVKNPMEAMMKSFTGGSGSGSGTNAISGSENQNGIEMTTGEDTKPKVEELSDDEDGGTKKID